MDDYLIRCEDGSERSIAGPTRGATATVSGLTSEWAH